MAQEWNSHHNDNQDNSSSHDPGFILHWALCSKPEGVHSLHARPKCMSGGQITPFHRRGCEGDQSNQGRRAF